ncbi:TolC family protein [Roseimarinus sediminis]|uniref:TolC family protein n=1 Tax=Roseimarinus sediminis TaxID=1610899 RepID=UPI003D1F1093
MNTSKWFFMLVLVLFFQQKGTSAQELYTLEHTLEVAYENSPAIQQSKLNLLRSRESLNAQKAALKSRFALNVSPFTYSNQREYSQDFQEWRTYENMGSNGTFSISQPIKASDGTLSLVNRFGFQSSALNDNDPVNSFSNNVQLRFDQPIFTYNRTKMNLRELELDLENSLLSYAMQKLNIEMQVTRYFYQVYQQQQSLLISREELDNQQKSFDLIKNKVEAGLAAREELWQAELNLANARSSVYNAEVSLANAKDELKQTIGLPLEDEMDIIANVEVKTIDVEMADAIDYALKQRMELRQREIDIENARFNLIQVDANNEFKGNVSLAVGLFGDNEEIGKLYDSPTDNQQVALSFEIPLWDWGQKQSSLRAAEASLKMQELNFENEKVSIKLNIRQIYRDLQNMINQIEIAQKSIENARLTYELNLEKYENGDLTGMDLSLYQNQLSSQKNELTNALINYKLGLLNMKIQTLWDFEKRTSIVPSVYSPEFEDIN